MTRLALDLSDEDARWAESRVRSGDAPSVNAYFADLARRDREQAEEADWLNAELARGDASGVDPRSVDEIFDEVEAEFFGR